MKERLSWSEIVQDEGYKYLLSLPLPHPQKCQISQSPDSQAANLITPGSDGGDWSPLLKVCNLDIALAGTSVTALKAASRGIPVFNYTHVDVRQHQQL